jgi:hypothetical protein
MAKAPSFGSGMDNFLSSDIGKTLTGYVGLEMLGMGFEDTSASEDAKAKKESYISKLEGLLNNYQSRYNKSTGNIDDLFNNAPKIDLSESKKYLSEGDEYISSMLDDSKSLSRSEMPGMEIYKDQIGTNTANVLQQLRQSGGLNSGNLTSILQGNQSNNMNIALEAGNYKTQMRQNLIGNYGQAAGMKQNQSSISSGISNTEYSMNEMMPWQSKMDWEQKQATAFDPLNFVRDLYGSQIGMSRSDEQSAMMSEAANKQANQQNTANVAGMILKLFA